MNQMAEKCISLSELTKEIYNENSIYVDYESFDRTIRKKYNFLTNRVVMRSKLDWRYKRKEWIPLKDKSIVKALLIKAYEPLLKDKEDRVYIDWFNNSIDENDLYRIIKLGFRVELLIREEVFYDDWDMEFVTADEWIAAIHSSINLTRALSVKKFESEMALLYDSSNVLNHDIPFGDMIRENEYGKRSYIWKGLSPTFDTSRPIGEILKGCFSQEDYANVILQLMNVIIQDCKGKTIDFIKAYAAIKKVSGCSCADELIENNSLASEYIKVFQNIYEYLYDRPELTKEIEKEIGTENLLDFFKMKDRNAKKPKKTKK